MFSGKLFGICAAIGIFFGVSVAFAQDYFSSDPKIPSAVTEISFKNVAEQKQVWSSYLDEVGGHKAYADFRSLYVEKPFYIQHGMMHLFADVLYQKFGLEGISFCDSVFGFGCFHQISIDAINQQGIDITTQLEDICVARYGERRSGFCSHGIGHGLVEYFGNTQQGLIEALDACSSKLVSSNGSRYCIAGAFMEYQRIPFFGGFDDPLPIDPEVPAALCAENMPEKYKGDCYKSLGAWWYVAYKGNLKEIFRACDTVPANFFEACNMGIGIVVPPQNNFSITKVENSCKDLSNTISTSYCLAGSSRAYIIYQNEDLSEEMCADILPTYRELCTYK